MWERIELFCCVFVVPIVGMILFAAWDQRKRRK